MRLWLHSIFNAGYWAALYQYYEYLYTLVEYGLEQSLWWSGTKPFLHHGYIGFIIIYLTYVAFTWKDYEVYIHRNTAMRNVRGYKRFIDYLLTPFTW